ncbi:MAG: hypothetical protein AUG51_15795 [Acidobacteria bacterium 13_1_20CM_3_53_8]|nr:MAG: hypothetical protein AUG51_15795 [Acidobacteria bacterium 13_1_20CM_3_53_8]
MKVLLLEDNANDAELIKRELPRDTTILTLVQNRLDYERELALSSFDIILADFSVPGFLDFEALSIRSKLASRTPFIYVTGTLQDRTAAKTLAMGASDYVLKDCLARLYHSVSVSIELNKIRETTESLHPVKAEILVVEDDHDLSELLSQLFRMQDTVVFTAFDVKEAFELVNKHRFHIALVDMKLPNGSGSDVIRRIKEVSRNCMTIITSGHPNLIDMAYGLGYVGVLMKPFSVSSAHEILRKHRLNYND